MSTILLLLSVVLCGEVSELSVKVPLQNMDNAVGQTLEEFTRNYEDGNEMRRLKRVCVVEFEQCKLYRKKNHPAVFLYLDGQCKLIPDPTTYFNLFSTWGSVNWVEDDEWPQCFHGETFEKGSVNWVEDD